MFVIGEVAKPGAVELGGDMTVMQVLAAAGGFLEARFKFNYKDVLNGRNVEQNIRLLPGDTVLVR